MNRRYSVEWDSRDMRIDGQPVRSPLARFLVAACAVALGAAAVWLALFVVLPVLGVTVSIVIGVIVALLFAAPWVLAFLAAIGLLKWLLGR